MRAAFLVPILLLAGCLGGAEESPASEPNEPIGAASDPQAPADAGAPTPAAAGEDATSEAEPMPTTERFEWDGSTATSACVVNTACHVAQQPEGSWTEFSALGVTGRATRVTGELSWTATTPATTEIHLYVFNLDADGMPVEAQELTGPSPLAFDVDTSGWTGPGYAFSVHSHTQAAALFVEPSQPFSMSTEITWFE